MVQITAGLWSSMNSLLLFAAILIVLFLPGTAWMALIRSGRMDPLEKLAEAAGASLALTGLAALYLFLVGIRLNAGGMIGIYLAVLAFGTAAAVRSGWRPRINGWALLAGGALLAISAWRLYQARDLVLPAWVDSVHHSLLVRRLLDYGGLAPDWLPYLAAPLYYHYGFHILAAAFSFWSGLDPAQAVLTLGQVISACVAISVYRLGKAVWGRALPAGLAALFTAFGFHMPAYYLTWGRYPLLAGLIVLPLAMAAALEVQRTPADRGAWARLALYTAAVCFCHFLTVGLLGLFFLVLLGVEANHWMRSRSLRGVVWQPFAAAALGALVALPWLVRVWSYTHSMFSVDVPNLLDPAMESAGVWEYLVFLTGPLRSHILLIFGGIGLIAALLIGGRIRWIAVWGMLLAFLATPIGPRFNPFRPDHLAIVLFLPGSLLLADLLDHTGEGLAVLAEWVRTQCRSRSETLPAETLAAGASASGFSWVVRMILASGLPLVVGVGLAGWGLWETRDILNPVTILVEPADVKALQWVEQQTPPDARFFINSTAWFSGSYRGVDGGYWLLPYTGRFSIVPPVAYAWGNSADVLRIVDWSKRASEVKTCDEAFWSLVDEAQLTYVYLRIGAGSLQPEGLAACPGLIPVYAQGGVEIYQLKKSLR